MFDFLSLVIKSHYYHLSMLDLPIIAFIQTPKFVKEVIDVRLRGLQIGPFSASGQTWRMFFIFAFQTVRRLF